MVAAPFNFSFCLLFVASRGNTKPLLAQPAKQHNPSRVTYMTNTGQPSHKHQHGYCCWRDCVVTHDKRRAFWLRALDWCPQHRGQYANTFRFADDEAWLLCGQDSAVAWDNKRFFGLKSPSWHAQHVEHGVLKPPCGRIEASMDMGKEPQQ